MRLQKIPFSASGAERQALKRQNITLAKSAGINQPPPPPRSVIAQSGARKVITTWTGPASSVGVAGYRVYSPDENTLFEEIRDPNRRKSEVNANAGATPPVINVFVASINQQGVESTKVLVKGSALAEAGAPADPPTPPGWTSNPNRGAGSGRGD